MQGWFAAASCLVVCLVGHTAQSSATPKRTEYRVEAGVVYSKRVDGDLKLDAYLPESTKPTPAVLVVHGGAWRLGSRHQLKHFARELAGRGVAAFAISYRLAPKHKHPAQIDDCRDAVLWIRKHAKMYNVDPKRIGGLGYSAGAHLVALLAVTGKNGKDRDTTLQAVAAGGTPCDFRAMPRDASFLSYWLGGTRREKPDAYIDASPAAHVTKEAPPFFFFHGTEDRLVPIKGPREMHAALKRLGVESQFQVVKKAGHIAAVFNAITVQSSAEFLHERLSAAKGQTKSKRRQAETKTGGE